MKPKICWSAEADAAFRAYLQHLRAQPPQPGFPRKTLSDLAKEQGVKPIDKEELRELIRRVNALEGE